MCITPEIDKMRRVPCNLRASPPGRSGCGHQAIHDILINWELPLYTGSPTTRRTNMAEGKAKLEIRYCVS